MCHYITRHKQENMGMIEDSNTLKKVISAIEPKLSF